MSDYKAEVVENVAYDMKSSYAKNVDMMNKESMYPSWNAAADHQAKYPDAKLEGAKVRKQVML